MMYVNHIPRFGDLRLSWVNGFRTVKINNAWWRLLRHCWRTKRVSWTKVWTWKSHRKFSACINMLFYPNFVVWLSAWPGSAFTKHDRSESPIGGSGVLYLMYLSRLSTISGPHFVMRGLTACAANQREVEEFNIAHARLCLLSRTIMTSDISRRFPAPTVNYFAGSSNLKSHELTIGNRLDRCSHLRPNNEYLSYVLTLPSTKFLALHNLDCLYDPVPCLYCGALTARKQVPWHI